MASTGKTVIEAPEEEELTEEERALLTGEEVPQEAPAQEAVAAAEIAEEPGIGAPEEEPQPPKPDNANGIGWKLREYQKQARKSAEKAEALAAENADLRKKIEEAEARQIRANERFEDFRKRFEQAPAPQTQQPQPQAPQEQDPEPPRDDIVGHLEWETRQMRREFRQELAAQQQRFDAMAAGSTAANTVTSLQAAEQEFMRRSGRNDYYEAVDFLKNSRHEQLKMMGYEDGAEIRLPDGRQMSGAQYRNAVIANELGLLIQGARTKGTNPAQVAFDLAVRSGYKGPSEQEAAAASAPAPAAAPTRSIQEIAQRQRAAQSASAIPARPAAAPLTLTEIADMDDDEYDALVSKSGDNFIQRLGHRA